MSTAVAEISEADQVAYDKRLLVAQQNEAPIVRRKVDGKPVTWSPQPGSQTDFMGCPLFEVLYHGTRGRARRTRC